MIEKKLQDKVETVLADAIATEAIDTNPMIDPQVEESLKQTEITPEPPQPSILASDEPVADPEPVEVAGLGSVATSIVDGLKKRTMEAEAPPPIREVDQSLVIAPADPDEVRLINEQLGGEYTKGLNFPDILAS